MPCKPISNGHVSNGRMDLDIDSNGAIDDDDTDEDEDEDDTMQTEQPPTDEFAKESNLVNEALKYGQELQREFREDPRKEIKQALEDTFALIAYPDARQSSLAPLLEPDGRVPVAEELNGAILGRLLTCV